LSSSQRKFKSTTVSFSLRYFISSHLTILENKISSEGLEALTQLLLSGCPSLVTLSLSNIQSNVNTILEALAKGCPKIEELEISKNKIKANDCAALAKFLQV
jgi:hypothetical protein